MINSIILTILVIILVFGFLGFILYRERKNSELEIERFREFVRASKSKTLEDYEQSLPTKGELPKTSQDELVELDQVDPEQILKAEKE